MIHTYIEIGGRCYKFCWYKEELSERFFSVLLYCRGPGLYSVVIFWWFVLFSLVKGHNISPPRFSRVCIVFMTSFSNFEIPGEHVNCDSSAFVKISIFCFGSYTTSCSPCIGYLVGFFIGQCLASSEYFRIIRFKSA